VDVPNLLVNAEFEIIDYITDKPDWRTHIPCWSVMDDDLRQRLSRVESEFLCAMSGDIEAMAVFQQSFLSLQKDIDIGLRSNVVNDQTLQLAHSTTSRITLMTEAFLELQIQTDSLSSTFSDKVEEIIREGDRFSGQ
jgi:hypothetical protein